MFLLAISASLCMLFATPALAAPSSERTELALDQPGAVYFTPPEGWRIAEADQLPSNVKVMVVGKGAHAFSPSLNLTVEPYKGTLKQYLKIVKAINDSKGASWQDLGTIRTQAGNANLSQVDTKTQWGETRMMHVILLKNSHVYILTAAALKEEFPSFYKEFFSSLRSLHINKNVYEMVSNPKKRANLEKHVGALKEAWALQPSAPALTDGSREDLFQSANFQQIHWIPFLNALENDYKEMSPIWREQLIAQIHSELLSASAKLSSGSP